MSQLHNDCLKMTGLITQHRLIKSYASLYYFGVLVTNDKSQCDNMF